MKIKNIELSNWGRYQKTNLPVDVSKDRNIVLIRASNNYGKTTLFYAIKYALYGKKGLTSHKNQHEVNDWINRQSAAKGDGKMFVELIIEHEGKEYRLQRGIKFYQTNTGESIRTDEKDELQIFDQDSGKPLSDAGKENSTKQNWIDSMLIPLDVSQFFFFDGEDIKRYTDEPEDTVRKAILRVLGIKVLENAKTDLENVSRIFNELYNKKLTEQSSDEKTKSILIKKQNEIDIERKTITHLQGAYHQAKKLKDSYTELLKKNERSQEKINERTRIEESNDALEKNLNDNEVLLRNLNGISSLLLLDPLLKIIDSTEENPPSKDQWESISAKYMLDKKFKLCVCGTHIDETIKEKLEKKILELKPNPQADLKRFVESTISRTLPDRKLVELQHTIMENLRIQGEIDTNTTAIAKINNELPGKGQDATIPVLRDKEQKALDEMISYGRDVERAQDRLTELEKDESLLKRKLEQAINSEDVHIAEKQKQFVAKIKDAMQEAIETYYKFRKPELEKYVSDVFMKLINNKKLYSGITIGDDWIMKVKYYDGNLLPTYQYGPSAGASQIVATAFIAGLNKFAHKSGPVVIDTPLGRLDHLHRTNILQYYHNMSDQVIILYTPSEINDNDQVILEDSVVKHYEIISYDQQPDISRIVPYEMIN